MSYAPVVSFEPRRAQPGNLLSCEAGPKKEEEEEQEAEEGEEDEDEEVDDEEREEETPTGRDVSRLVSGMMTHLDVAGNVRLLGKPC